MHSLIILVYIAMKGFEKILFPRSNIKLKMVMEENEKKANRQRNERK